MRFEQLNEGVWAMTYLIVDEATNEAALVDPVYDFMQQYVDLLERRWSHAGTSLRPTPMPTTSRLLHFARTVRLRVRHVDRNGESWRDHARR